MHSKHIGGIRVHRLTLFGGMTSYVIFSLVCLAGAGRVLGSHIRLNITETKPDVGNTQVSLVCTFTVEPPIEARKIYIDKFKGNHDGWKTIAEFNPSDGTKVFVGEGLNLADRAELTLTEDISTMTFTSVDCDDTGRYKCDLTHSTHRIVRNIGQQLLEVQQRGETCGGASRITFSLLSALCIMIAFYLSR